MCSESIQIQGFPPQPNSIGDVVYPGRVPCLMLILLHSWSRWIVTELLVSLRICFLFHVLDARSILPEFAQSRRFSRS